MDPDKSFFRFLSDGVSFTSQKAAGFKLIYLPLCGKDSQSLKSSISPYLSGDIKTDKNRYVTKPASREDLRHPVRNFFLYLEDGRVLSFDSCTEEPSVTIGQLWQKTKRNFSSPAIELEALNFIPVSGDKVELMTVTVRNLSDQNVSFVPTAFCPIFGRALANKHDHEHVTALLNRVEQPKEGVLVTPTMYFNEEGHLPNKDVYYVLGISDNNELPSGSFPTVESFLGNCGSPHKPQAVFENHSPQILPADELNGKEASGALRFAPVELKPQESKSYFIVIGIADSVSDARAVFNKFNNREKMTQAFDQVVKFWAQKSGAIEFKTGQQEYNSWLKWVTIQPVLRRIFGNSFLPDHDYGKGGKGWRDIWQDLLSLILIEPEEIRPNLINNFGGVRIDGSNATIIGSGPGEFIADRNAITRVWMDHGVWPYLTTALYIDQTGDYDILFEQTTYFRDPQLSRTFEKDLKWTPEYGQKLKAKTGKVYKGTLLEHILVQHLVQFFNVGEHNMVRLESADWNDGLDMAFKRGESVAFTSFYGGNFLAIAETLERLKKEKSVKKIELAKEIVILLDTLSKKKCDYGDPEAKRKLLFSKYFSAVQPELSGKKISVKVDDLIADLRKKGNWIFEQVRKKEKVHVEEKGQTFSWFNGYYDNKAKRVDGKKGNRVWMTLTGQVFPLMSGLAEKKDVAEVVDSVNFFLKDKKLGGLRLNTDFGLPHYLDFGRAFGFAYGTKENGAFFSHMNVMYGFALYKQGFAREGFKVLRSIYKMSADSERSRIYPGIPEYFDSLGQGMYHFLTGSASWLVLTQLIQVFGVRGDGGDLVISPKLTKDEFGTDRSCQVSCKFAGKKLSVLYLNTPEKDFGQYEIKSVTLSNNSPVSFERLSPTAVKISKSILKSWPQETLLKVTLG